MKKEDDNDYPFWIYIAISIAFHLFVFLIFYMGLPKFRKEPEEQIMTFEVLPVNEISNIKTKKVQRDKAIKEEKSKKREKASKAEAPKKPVEKKEAPKKEKVALKEKPKPKAKKPDPKPKTPQKKASPDKSKKLESKKKKPNEMENLLKTLEKESEGKEAKSRKRSVGDKSNAIEDAIGKFKENVKLSIGEVQYIKQRMRDYWNEPIGAKNAGEISVMLYIAFEPNGTVKEVRLIDKTCPVGTDIICNAATDSAIRAVWQASPFDQLNPARYESWREINMEFTPEEF